ncbi:unnamed protein product [Trifolium pratense]|uniref:Uncharacterized protein n=1 Tax=Trifolium pratense TaxID=57577 RepID=A0ACB0L8X7_TRIPR|nr:unnamed protein product [Trifolium pratense]
MVQPEEPFKVVEVCNVEPFHGPTKPSQSAPTLLPLTFFDLLCLRSPPVECLYFYELTNSTTFFYKTILPNLKHSLSLTLQHFLPLAGNITWPIDSSKPFINYVCDDSVSFTVVESKASFKDISSHYCEASKRHHLIPLLETCHEKASLISIQVTLFPNNGFCLGITTHHAAFDGKSASHFMKSWSYITCSNSNLDSSFLSLPENLTPFFDRSLIQDHDNGIGISEAYVVDYMKQGGPNNKSVKVIDFPSTLKNDAIKSLFELSPSNIQKLKQHAKNEMKMNVTNLSRLEMYSIDFGFGKPKKVDIASTDKTGAFSHCETRYNDGGVEIGLALNKQEMETFSTLFVQELESI